MAKIIAILLIIAAAWFVYNNKINVDTNKLKDSSIETIKKERIINTVNSSRENTQKSIDEVTK